MEFNKYKKRGAYHWKEFNQQTVYRENALFIKNWVTSDQILDVGAGDGLITYLIGAKGIDNNELAVKLAKGKGADVMHGDSNVLPFDDDSFDGVLMADVIEHIQYPANSIKEVKRVLNDGGMFYVVTPPKGGKMDKYHYREYTPEELVKYIEGFGFTLVDEVTVKNEWKRMYAKFKI